MARKLNSMPDYRANMPKEAHDVSQSLAYTCCPGALNPVYFDMLHTGDELHFSAAQFTRLNPMVSPAMGEIDVHLDYFYVPLTVMYTPASSMFYQTDDLISSQFDRGNLDSSNFPVCDLASYMVSLNTQSAFTGSAHLDSNNGLSALHFDCLGKSVCRVVDFFDLGLHACLNFLASNSLVGSTYPKFTPWFPLAYQAIYQLYFRNDDRELKNYHYNIDQYYQGTDIVLPTTSKSIFELNYASRPKDYFNSVKVSPIGSAVSSLSGNVLSSLYGHVNDWLNDGGSRLGDNVGDGSFDFGDSDAVQTVGFNSGGYTSVGTNQIRQMFMVDKLLRVVGRAEKNYESQFLAHYGIRIPHDVMHNITHIGHDMLTLNPDSVESVANTWLPDATDPSKGTGSALGEFAGKCQGMLSGSKKNFKAPFHGVFMVISHIVPRRRYVAGLNKLHSLNSPDKFWQPEFDKKGMEPLFTFEAVCSGTGSMTDRIGWQFAYEMFKRKYDRVSGAFTPTRNSRNYVNTYSPWVIANVPFGEIEYSGSAQYGPTGSIVARPSDLLVSPNDLNIVMQVPHNTAFPSKVQGQYLEHQLFETDPFICDFNLHCKKVNMMSAYGEPEL